MSTFSRKTSINILLFSINIILLTIISRVVIADETTNAILEQSIYLYYYESDDELLGVGESQLYTFAPIPGEDITIVSYGLDDTARISVSLFDSSGNQVATGTSNQVTEKLDTATTDTSPQSPFITAIQHTANSSGLYYFEVKNESGQEGLIRTMLFVGDPFNTDLTLIDELNPLLPSKAFMVAGDPNREWINELTGETIQGLRTEVDVLPIKRIDRAPDVFLSYSTLTYLPDVAERSRHVTFYRWFNEDDQEIYLVNIRPIPEQETAANRTILENIDYQTYNSNNFFFFEYLFSVGNGSDPIALDRGAGACAGLADRTECIASDPNLGRETSDSTDDITTTTADATVVTTTQLTVQGDVVTVTIDTTQICTSFANTAGNPVTISVSGTTSSTVCLPYLYIPTSGTLTTIGVTSISGTSGNQQNRCEGTSGDDVFACTTGDDWIEALGGNDAIFADAGNDDIFGGAGEDFIVAGDGNDNVEGGSGYDEIDGGAGDDTINLGADGGVTIGGTGADTFVIDDEHGSGDSSIIGGGTALDSSDDGSRDTFDFNGDPNGSIELYTDSFDLLDFTDYSSGVTVYPDAVSGSSLSVTVVTGDLPSNISGSGFADTFNLGGSCAISSASGCGSTINYSIDANAGADTINTGAGNDTIDGGADNDTIDAGSGDDTITGNTGNDIIDGGIGTDTFDEVSATTTMNVTLVNGDGSSTGQGNDTLTSIENINTGSGDDTFAINDSGDNIINAGSGTDEATISVVSGTTTVTRSGTDVSVSGTGVGLDQYNSVELINISGSADDDIIELADENDNIVIGNGGSDTVEVTKNTTVSGTITITRSGDDVNVSGTGIGTDIYNAISTVNVTGSTDNETFYLTDENDNTITGNGGTDVVNVSSTAGSTDDETITITRTGSDVTVISAISGGGSGIGNDAYNDIDQVNITGGDGDDIFNIFDELDNIFDGGDGTDTANYSSISGGLTITIDSSNINTVSGIGIGTDIIINIENINSGNGDDTFIIEDEENNVFDGGAGDDEAIVIMENVYSGVITIIRDPISTVTVSGQGFGVDVFTNIEKVSVTSVGGDDVFRPNDDQDNDFDAGAGTDWIDYSTITGSISVIVNISAGTATGDGNDTLAGFENISGSIGNDTLTGDSAANIIDGNTGNDTIDGGGGDDTLIGNTGNDIIDGGSGTDTFDESNATTAMDVTLVSGDGSSTSTGQGSDTLTSIENVNTGSGDDTLSITDSGDNIFNANNGTDEVTVSGGSGTITITRSGGDVNVSGTGIGNDQYNSVIQVNVSGSSTDDTFIVSDENDNILYGGDGIDTISYESISTPMTVTIVDSQASISATGIGVDTLYNFENITTGSGVDYFSISGTVDTNLNSTTGADIFYFNTSVDGSLALETDDSAHLEFGDFGEGVTIDLSSNTAQTIATSFIVNLSGTFTSISGTAFVDSISGTAIADTIYGGDGADLLDGNAGADSIYGEAGADTINGGAGNDTLDGGAGADTLNGGADNDIINGGADNDTIDGGDGDDDIDGGDGTDFIDESSNSTGLVVTLSDVAGDGSIVDSVAFEIDTVDNVENIDTGSGLDTLFISDSDDNIINAGGDDDVATVSGGSGTITITRTGDDVDVSDTGGGIGTDEYNSVIQVNVSGSATDDTFVVSDANDNEFNGLGGIDTISYAALSTPITVTIVGNQASISATGIGADTLYNIENIFTGTGDDYFDINGTVDYALNASTGADIFFFNASVDGSLALETSDSAHLDFSSFTSSGITIDLSSAVSQSVTGSLTIKLTGTFTTISGTTSADTISGTTGDDTIWADGGDDTIFGNDGADTLDGNAGADTIDGGAGADTIKGGTGNDTITGGADNDIIDGGDDTDTFDESDSSSDITIVLDSTSGTSSSTGEGSDTLTNIENITTGSGDDDFTLSDSGLNVISASSGTDTVTILNAINITVIRSGDNVFITDNSTGVGDDEYYSVEQVNISGTSADNTFTMNDGFANIINGQGGTNEVDYSLVTAVINVNVLSTGMTISSTGTGNDTLINIQNITTGDGNDTFIIEENSVNNIFDAASGTDTATYTISGTISATRSGSSLIVQISGSDTDQLDNFENVNFVGSTADDTFVIQDTNDNTIDGNGGTDTYDASFATNDITVNVSSSVTAVGTDVGTDTLVSIENIITGDGDDTFIINTDVAGTYFFNAGGSTLGNTFQFTGNATQEVHITISSDSPADDTLDFSQFTGSGIDIDLSDSSEQEVATNLFITFNSFIGDVIGTDNNDTIEGNSLTNNISGGAGNDTIVYSAGNDIIDGGAGTDTVDYTGALDSITATLTSSTITVAISGTSDTNTLTNVEIISGTNSDDTIIISEAVSTTVNAGGGTDTVDYSGLGAGLAIDINLTTGIGHVSGTSTSDDHTLNDIEDVIGSNLNDTIVGNSSNNNLDGGAGDDFIQGNGGDDIIEGGSGTNTISYKDATTAGVDVNLASGTSTSKSGGSEGSDTFTNIDNVSGSSFADNISGSSGTNVIYGGGGDDTIYGNEGNDEIYGEAGNDTLYGGSLDAVSGTSDDGSDTIYGGADNDTIYGGNNNTGGGTGNDDSDTIDGGDGDDTIFGGNDNTGGGSGDDGSDTIEGGEGDDTIFGGNDNTDAGSGDDGSDIITDNTNSTDDNDTIYGGNDNTSSSGSGPVGTGTDTDGDNIDVNEPGGAGGPSEKDTVAGDNKIDSDDGTDSDGSGDDTINKDGSDDEDFGDDT